nr:1-phosphatidylinositol-4-phosphate 5-kinase [Theileria orientalis]
MRVPVCGVRRENLLPKLPSEYFRLLNETIECSQEEAQLIYNKFRALAPTGRLTLYNFQECLGLFGTIGRLLAERMFRAFDLNNDEYLDFVEFSSSLLVMTRGKEEKKLALSYRIIHPNPQNLPNSIIGSLELSGMESKSGEVTTRRLESGNERSENREREKEQEEHSQQNELEKQGSEDLKTKERSQLSSSSLGFIRMTTQSIINTTKILSSITDMGSEKGKREEEEEEEEGIQFGEFVDFVNDIALTKALLVCREPQYYSNDKILKIFQKYASVSKEGIKRLTQSDYVDAVCESSEFLEFLGISLSQYAVETVSSSYKGVNMFLQRINASTFGYINRTKMKRKNVYKWMNNAEAKRGLSVHFGHESWNNVVNMMIGLSIAARYVYSQQESELREDDYSIKLCFDITENVQGLNVNMYVRTPQYPSLNFNSLSEYYKHTQKSRRFNRNYAAGNKEEVKPESRPESDQKNEEEGKLESGQNGKLERKNRSNSWEGKLGIRPNTEELSKPENTNNQEGNHVNKENSYSSISVFNLEDAKEAEQEGGERENREISSSSLLILSNMSNSNLLTSDMDFRFTRFYKDNLNDIGTQQGGRQFNDAVKSRVIFKEYAPMVFRQIRKISGISEKDYTDSVSPEQIVGSMVLGNLSTMSELVSEGKSGALFYYTINGKLILKTVTKACAKFVKRWLKRYYAHLKEAPTSILTRFYGLFSITNVATDAGRAGHHGHSAATKKTYFVVMNNVFYSQVSVHRRFDLKGSWVGRELHPSDLKDPTVALKDVDFDRAAEPLLLGPKTEGFMATLKKDVEFLRDSNLLDYSLLLGVHYRDQSRDQVNWEEDREPRPGDQHRIMATDHSRIYYVGIVDLLTPWDFVKRLEHAWRVVQTRDHLGVSCVNPDFYCRRFVKFISDHLK